MSSNKQLPALPFAFASLAVSALAAGLCLLLQGPAQTAALTGIAASALGSVCSFVAVAVGLPRGTNGVLAGFTLGFLVRLVLVAAGLVAIHAQGTLALVYTGAFFAVFAATQTVEILYVQAASRVRAPGAVR